MFLFNKINILRIYLFNKNLQYHEKIYHKDPNRESAYTAEMNKSLFIRRSELVSLCCI